MVLAQEKVGDFVVLRVADDRVDSANHTALSDLLSSLVGAGDHKFVLDLSSVGFMDSSALAGLIPAVHVLPNEGCLLLAGLHPRMEQIFKLTKLDTIFNIYSSVDEALLS
ncbi:STAS domain-containing protein [Maridesulfovibrio sp.]|uniref:STAS domain-containing protein n=1 Tax=Maridesulfovibrio sp. TaxID=2795000 RepID=UPI0029F45FFB|nr:STAS domain-containing protein [Maridesulfovibrio sp.]